LENGPDSKFIVDKNLETIAMPTPIKNIPLEILHFLKPENVKYFSVKVEKRGIKNINNSKNMSQSVRIGNSSRMELKTKKLEEQRKKFGLNFYIKKSRKEVGSNNTPINSDDETQNTNSTDNKPKSDMLIKEKAIMLADLHNNKEKNLPITEANTIQEQGQNTSDDEDDDINHYINKKN